MILRLESFPLYLYTSENLNDLSAMLCSVTERDSLLSEQIQGNRFLGLRFFFLLYCEIMLINSASDRLELFI